MALLFCDGFDSYTSTASLNQGWSVGSSGWTYGASIGRLGGGGIQCVNSATAMPTPFVFSVAGGAIMETCFWMKYNAIPAAAVNIFGWYNSILVQQALLGVTNVTGFLRFADGGGTLRLTGVTNVADNNWHWIELWTNTGNGQVQKCWVDGILQWNGAALMSPSGGIISAIAVVGSSANTITYDDIIFADNNSPSPVSTDLPIGTKQITTFRPNGDNTVQFTPSSGVSNYLMVNEQAADSDTSYVQSTTSGQADLYDYENFAFTPGVITGAQLTSYVKNPGAGAISFKNRCKSNLTTTDGASTVASPNWQQFTRTPYSVDPNTAAAWTPSGFNAATFGITVV